MSVIKKGFLNLILTSIMLFQVTQSHAKKTVQLAIVLDDIGNSQNDFQALTLPAAITFSILPYTPYAKKMARLAQQQGRELLLHIPMQAKTNNEKLGAGALMLNMQEQQFKECLSQSLRYLPDATGINNHMGSVLTEEVKQMQWTMDILQKQGLYFLDSRTTAQSIAENTAKQSGVPALRRHVFLDNIKTKQAMEKQFQHAIKFAQKNLSVVIIAHPYPQTIAFLSEKFNQQNKQVKLVSLQALLPPHARSSMAKKRQQLRQVNKSNNSNFVNLHSTQIQ